MSEVTRIRPVTMIHEVFRPTPVVHHAIREFLEGDIPDDQMDLHATGYRVVDTKEYYQHQYDRAIHLSEIALKRCGSAPLLLTGRSSVQEGSNAQARLLLEVEDPHRLSEMILALSNIPSLEQHLVLRNLLYIDLARDALTRNIMQRNKARDELASKKRHPGFVGKIQVSAPTILKKDIRRYPLRM